MFSVRIVSADHYTAEPIRSLDVCYSDFRASECHRVPVVRIYGSTPAGQKTCMHIHGIFPYLYVPYDGDDAPERHLKQFANSVDKALNVALGKASSRQEHVYKVTLVSAIPFYGYHEEEQPFMKIYLYNPQMVKKVADLLLGGAVMNKVYQPHESHIPYLQQMFIDFNLYGMNMLNVSAVKFRIGPDDEAARNRGDGSLNPSPGTPVLQSFEKSFTNSPCTQTWNMADIPGDLCVERTVARHSTCELEVDVVAADILNREEVGSNVGANPGLRALWDDERQRRRLGNLSSQLSPPSSPDRGHIPWTSAEADLQDRLQDIIDELGPLMVDEGDSSESDDQSSPPSLPASQVDVHQSQRSEGPDSQDTVILDDEDDSETSPVINEMSILRVVSSTQSFRQERAEVEQNIGLSQDQSVLEMLASLADTEGASPPATQAGSQGELLPDRAAILERRESLLTQVSSGEVPGEEDEEQEEADTSIVMSQSVWDGDVQEGEIASQRSMHGAGDFDLEGFDVSWNSSQLVEVQHDSSESEISSEEEYSIPQVDGMADEKTETKRKRRSTRAKTPSSEHNGENEKEPVFAITATTFEGKEINFTGDGSEMIKKRLTGKFGPIGTIRNDSIPKLFLDLRKPEPIRICTSRVGNKVPEILQQAQRTPVKRTPSPTPEPEPQTRRSTRKKAADKKLRNGVSESREQADPAAEDEKSQVAQNTVEVMTPIVDENGMPVVVNVTIETDADLEEEKAEEKGQSSPAQRQNIFAAMAAGLGTSPTKDEFMTLGTDQESEQNLQPVIDVQDMHDLEGLEGVTIEPVGEAAQLEGEQTEQAEPGQNEAGIELQVPAQVVDETSFNTSGDLEEGEIDFTGIVDKGVPLEEGEEAAKPDKGKKTPAAKPKGKRKRRSRKGQLDADTEKELGEAPPVLEKEAGEVGEEREEGEIDMSQLEGDGEELPVLIPERPPMKSSDAEPSDSDMHSDVNRTPPAAVIVPRIRESDSESEEGEVEMRPHIGEAAKTYAKPGEKEKPFARLLERETDKPFTDIVKHLGKESSQAEEEEYELVIEKEDVKSKTKKRKSPSQRAGSILEKKRGIGADEQQPFEPPTESTEPGPSGPGRGGIRTRGGGRGGVKTRGGVRTRGGIRTRGAARSAVSGSMDTDEDPAQNPAPRTRRRKDSDIVEESTMPATGLTNVIIVSPEKGQVFVSSAELGAEENEEEEQAQEELEDKEEQTNVRSTRSGTRYGKGDGSPKGKQKRQAHPLEGSPKEGSSKNIKAMFYGKGESPRTSAPWEVKRPVSLADRKFKLSQKKKQIQEEALKAAAAIGRKETPEKSPSSPKKKSPSKIKSSSPAKKSPEKSPQAASAKSTPQEYRGGPKSSRGGKGPPFRGFRQVNPLYANYLKAAIMAPRSNEPMVVVSKPIRVNYFRGQSVTSGKTQGAMTLGYDDRVRVPKCLYEQYEVEVVGSEKLELSRMTDEDVIELKGQVRKEMEHKRKEHIMPLVLQMSPDEIEKNYSKVKEKLAAEPEVFERDSEPEEYYLSPDEKEEDKVADEADSRSSSPIDIPRKKAKVESAADQDVESEKEDDKEDMEEDVEMGKAEDEPEIVEESQKSPESKEVEGEDQSDGNKGSTGFSKSKKATITPEVEEAFAEASPPEEVEKPDSVIIQPLEKLKQEPSKSRDSSFTPSEPSPAPKSKVEVVKTMALAAPASPRSSFESSEVPDFSLLENPMDTDNEGPEPVTVEETSTRPLHTPPMTVESDHETSEETEKRLKQASEDLRQQEAERQTEPASDQSKTGKPLGQEVKLEAPKVDSQSAFAKALSSPDQDLPTKFKRAKTRRFPSRKPVIGQKSQVLDSPNKSDIYSPTKVPASEGLEKAAAQQSPSISKSEDAKSLSGTEKKRTKSSGSESSDSVSSKKRKTSDQEDNVKSITKSSSAEPIRQPASQVASSEAATAAERTPQPERKSQRKRKPTDYVAMVAGNYDPSPLPKLHIRPRRKFKGCRSMRVKLDKKVVEDYLTELQERRERELEEEELMMMSEQKLASDNPLENEDDPLWQAQKERLADLPSKPGPKSSKAYYHEDSSADSEGSGKKVLKKKGPRSMHQKLSTAFVTPKKKKKTGPKHGQKMMANLSMLHQKTLEKLERSDTPDSGTPGGSGPSSYSEEVEEDHTAPYDDVMQKLAYLSPHHSENEEGSPPRPSSPSEGSEDHDSPTPMNIDHTPSSTNGDKPVPNTPGAMEVAGDSGGERGKKPGESAEKGSSVPYTVREEVVRFPASTSSASPKASSPKWGITVSPDSTDAAPRESAPADSSPPLLTSVDNTDVKQGENGSSGQSSTETFGEAPKLDSTSPAKDFSPDSDKKENTGPDCQDTRNKDPVVGDTSIEIPRRDAGVSDTSGISVSGVDCVLNLTQPCNQSVTHPRDDSKPGGSAETTKAAGDDSHRKTDNKRDGSRKEKTGDDEDNSSEDDSNDDSDEESEEDEIRSPSPSPIHSPEPDGIRSPSPIGSPSPTIPTEPIPEPIPMEPIPMDPQPEEPEPSSPSETGSGAPAMIPLHIEDPHVEEEVEKARQYKLKAITGQIDPTNDPELRRKLAALRRSRSKSDSGSSGSYSPGKDNSPGKDPCSVRDKPVSRGTGKESGSYSGMPVPSTSRESSSSYRSQDRAGGSPPSRGTNDPSRGSGRGGPSPPSPSGSRPIKIIRPAAQPPSKEQVSSEAAALGLGREQVQDPYVSRAEDQPDRPREVGRRVLKVQTNLVKDLEEFESCLQSNSLKEWRFTLLADQLSSIGNSQATIEELLSEFDKNPSLYSAMISNKPVILTALRKPPSKNTVTEWVKGKKLYQLAKEQQQMQHKNDKAAKQTEKGKVGGKFTVKSTKHEPKVEIKSKIHELSPSPESPRLTGEGEGDVSSDRSLDDSAIDSDLIPPSPESKRPPSTPHVPLIGSQIISSTPSCTPSVRSSAKSPLTVSPIVTRRTSDSPTSDVEETPSTSFRKPRPPRRRSSDNSQSSLRRVLMTTQLKQQFSTPSTSKQGISQIEGPTPKNSFGFKVGTQNVQDAKALHEFQYLTIVSMELHVRTRGESRPDPDHDPIRALFYTVHNDVPPSKGQREQVGAIVMDDFPTGQAAPGAPDRSPIIDKHTLFQKTGICSVHVTYVKTEEQLIEDFVQKIKRWDPDMLVGYEIQMLSWGYLLQRSSTLSMDICAQLSRIPDDKKANHFSAEKDEYGSDHMSEVHIGGRIVLNLWRLLRHEVALNVYSFENLVFHVLHKRIPHYTFRSLNHWYEHRTNFYRWRTIEYYITRTKGVLELMEKLDLIGQTSEFARVFGIEFYHVLSRGSQYRVESMMLRIAKPMNYIPVSPSVQQRARMKAPECIPLNMEPDSRFYSHPVAVLDFQSLYPSIMIAYNYCFSTCLGRIESFPDCNDGNFDFGCTSLNLRPRVLKKLHEHITICPNGVAFVKPDIRKGVLPRMVEDILKTRLMVKKSMKEYKDDKTLQKLLHARQLGLKLIANVTFGYTSANFSGRMPCVEIGDSIVRKARETLERAIRFVESKPEWNAKVVYGDTDSLFVELRGRTKDEALKIGQEMAVAVTADNPKPVKLKFEKVYMPCVLQTKKRYVGFLYETPEQKEPVFDAKGIETVRRDNCPAVSKVLERCIKTLFTTRDISLVKQYVKRQCQKLMEGKVSLQDCIFAKEYRGMPGYRPGACVPALEIAKKRLSKDKRNEPRVGERVPYVIVYGTPGLPLIQLVREPHEVINDPNLRLNATYYISKQILPPLDRMFSLIGVDVFSWYNELPRIVRAVPQSHTTESKKGTISQYFTSLTCPVCETTTQSGMCAACRNDPQRVAVVLADRIHTWEQTHHGLSKICTNCMGCQDYSSPCDSLDCPIMYRLNTASRDLTQIAALNKIQDKLPERA